MNSISFKLIFSSALVVLISVLLISIPVIKMEVDRQEQQIINVGTLEVDNSYAAINQFLTKPISIVENVSSFMEQQELSQSECEELLAASMGTDENFYVLYYTNNVPCKDGGFMYSSDGWEPLEDDPEYDQTTQDWFLAGYGKNATAISEPYVDEESGNIVTTVVTPVNAEGYRKGVIGLDIMLDTIFNKVNAVKLSKSGKSYLLSEDGLYITNEDSSKILSVDFYSEHPELFNYKSAASENASFVKIDKKSGVYFACRKISEASGWVFVTYGPIKEIFANLNKDIFVIVLLSIVSLGVAIGVAVLVAGRLVSPIKTVDSSVNEIASGRADLSRHIEVKSNDEVGSLVNGFNTFVDKLAEIVRQLKNSKGDLSLIDKDLQSAISQASAAIEKISKNIKNVGTEVDGQHQAVNQTSAAVAEIAENINSLERMIERQSRGVSDASSAVEQMIGNISSVNSSVEKMADSFSQLQSNASVGMEKQKLVAKEVEEVAIQSKSLQDANKAIASVAAQTNLLAMNAAIEAAHAGEAGKGFSVVADEIRKLSETSSAQSKKIGSELQKIQVKISQVVEASKSSNENFDTIIGMIEGTDELVRQIKAAMEEQQEGSKQIVDSLKTMNDSTSEVRIAGHEMLEGNQLILAEVKNLQNTTLHIKESMDEMSASTGEIDSSSVKLFNISSSVKTAVEKIGNEIDEFDA